MGTTWINPFPVFNPLDLTPQLWLDASDTATITASSGAVSQWDDKSGNGYHVTQATGANQPTTGSVTKNGLNTIDFDGGDNLNRAPDTGLGQNVTGLTIYSVVKYDLLGSRTVFALTTGTSTSTLRILLGANLTGDLLRVAGRTLDADSLVTVTSSAKSTGVWYSQIGVFDYANTDLFQYVNGSLDGSTTSFQTATTTSNTQSQNLVIGDQALGGSALDGSVGEILVYHSAHNSSLRQTVLQYLNNKWGL